MAEARRLPISIVFGRVQTKLRLFRDRVDSAMTSALRRPPREMPAVRGGADAERLDVLPGPDTFVLYRIVGNDLPPLHAPDQSLDNLRFLLEHEPLLEDCEKRFVINRVVDPERRAAMIDLLEQHGQPYLEIPFEWSVYRQIPWALDDYPIGYLLGDAIDELPADRRDAAIAGLYRHKNNYVMNNNGARNAALADGRGRAKWVLPWDGNCFLTKEAWETLRAGVRTAPHHHYVCVPMARAERNVDVVEGRVGARQATHEPQLIFRCDADHAFDERFPYGRRSKVELLWRLGVRGAWDKFRLEAWDLPPPTPVPAAHHAVGWVARLDNGNGRGAAARSLEMRARGSLRNQAIIELLSGMDSATISPFIGPDRLRLFDDASLARLAATAEGDGPPGALRASILAEAEEALGRGPFSPLQKTTRAPSGDPRDYWHPAPYWWPNPASPNGLPYIRRDGERAPGTVPFGPGSEQFDRSALQRVFDDTTALALAWGITGDPVFARHAAERVRMWFLDPDTAMTAHLRYAQVRLGHAGNEGAPAGIIEAKDFYYFLDAVTLCRRAGALSQQEADRFAEWLEAYLGWLLDSPQGRAECRAVNNHGTYYDLQVAAIAAYLGEARLLLETFRRAEDRLRSQVTPDGAQPGELKRRDSRHYCAFNLAGWVALAVLAERCGLRFEGGRRSDGRDILNAVAWLLDRPQAAAWPDARFDVHRLAPLAAFAAHRRGEPAPPFSDAAIRLSEETGLPPFWPLSGIGVPV
ncbi:alginate lyase family protein [Prosthecomicrobium pneumaticum]|uniref:Alginate lyase domain-containing protein n=1 Tax=Prosthecomicrobium pneumaticum TaxID=81895 RepID=A0A7W9FPA8_9HYPH|nr:alginate lyase family protein [Prosthecomicrobium pneumaticum]MBB5754290.1 hypothetical protein [Prosthecomicrobium pneumaticum]